MNALVMVLSAESIPVGVLVSLVIGGCPDVDHARPLRRRPRFWLRFTGVLVAMLLPDLVAGVLPLGEQALFPLVLLGLAWGLLLLVPSGFVLFHRADPDPGPADDDDQGPGPGDDRPTPSAPTGGIPLADAEPSSRRIRDHDRPRRIRRPRRPGRERERLPTRLRPLRLWPSWGHMSPPTIR